MVLARITTPSCMEVEMSQLELLKELGLINNYDVNSWGQ
jgi:hypothetical protein